MTKKEAIAREIKGNKLVFGAGSAVLFGLRTKDIQNLWSIPCVNMGVNASLQMDYILYRLKNVLKPGDVVFLLLEYELFFDKGELQEGKLDYIISFDREYFFSLPFSEQIKYLLRVSPKKYYNTIIYNYKVKNQESRVGVGYNSSTLNENGDETYNVGNKKIRGYPIKINPIKLKGDISTGSLGLTLVEEFNKWCSKNKIHLFIIYPCTIFFEKYHSEVYHRFFEDLQRYFKKHDIKTIGTPYDFFFDRKYAYDTHYHLNDAGMTLMTRSVVKKIEHLDVIKALRNQQAQASLEALPPPSDPRGR